MLSCSEYYTNQSWLSVGICSGLHIISPTVRFLGSGLKEAMIHGTILSLVCEFYILSLYGS